MSKLAKTFARAASFAHLLGLATKAEQDDNAQRAEETTDDDDERKQRDGESDEDYATRMAELDDKEEKARKAESDDKDPDDDADANNGNEQEDDKDKAARGRERARCAAIIAHGIGAGCAEQAGVFAFDTDLTAPQAIAALKAAASVGGPRTPGLGNRMAAVKLPKVTTDSDAAPDAGTAKGQAALIIAAGKKARGES